MAQIPFISREGLGVRNTTGDSYILRGTIDPSTGVGIAAPISSIYLRENGVNSTQYTKIGPLDTDWSENSSAPTFTPISSDSVPDVDSGSTVVLDSVLTDSFRTAKWIVNVSKGTDFESFELKASAFNNIVSHSISAITKIGDPDANIGFDVDVSLSGVGAGQEMQLTCTVATDDVQVEFTRIVVV